MKVFILALCLAWATSLPVDPSDEVELVEPVNTNTKNPEGPAVPFGGVPIIIIRTSSGSDFGGFDDPIAQLPFNPFFSRPKPFFGGFDGFPVEAVNEGGDIDVQGGDVGEVLRDLFGIPRKDDTNTEASEEDQNTEEEGSSSPCGFLCTLFKDLHSFADKVEGEIDEIHKEMEDKKNEIEPAQEFDEGADKNSTYTEEVLEDGTVVKTNRTVIKNPNGVSFVISQTASFPGGNDSTSVPSLEGDDATTVEEQQEEEEVKEDPIVETKEVPADEINELDGESEVGDKAGVDEGLLEVEA